MYYIIIILLILLILYISLYYLNIIENYENDLKCNKLKCRSGPSGKQGPPGYVYTDKGLLMNLDKKNMVMDRFAGSGNYAEAYLTKGKNYKKQQIWTLYSNNSEEMSNKLQNGYGGCLNIINNKVNMTKPENCKSATKWSFTTQGTIVPISNKELCLNYDDKGIVKLSKCPSIITDKYQWAFI